MSVDLLQTLMSVNVELTTVRLRLTATIFRACLHAPVNQDLLVMPLIVKVSSTLSLNNNTCNIFLLSVIHIAVLDKYEALSRNSECTKQISFGKTW